MTPAQLKSEAKDLIQSSKDAAAEINSMYREADKLYAAWEKLTARAKAATDKHNDNLDSVLEKFNRKKDNLSAMYDRQHEDDGGDNPFDALAGLDEEYDPRTPEDVEEAPMVLTLTEE